MEHNTYTAGDIYGTTNDYLRWINFMQHGPLVASFPSDNYVKVPMTWHDAVYGIESNLECIPHLLQWGVDQVEHKGTVLNWIVKKALVPYLQNMNDDELAMVDPMLTFIYAFGKVQRIQCFPASVELCVEVNGVQRTLLINVMNMMEIDGGNNDLVEYYARETLN